MARKGGKNFLDLSYFQFSHHFIISHHADGPCALRVGPVAVRLRATVVKDEVVAEVADDALLNEPLRGGQAQEEERKEEGKQIHFHFAKSGFRLFLALYCLGGFSPLDNYVFFAHLLQVWASTSATATEKTQKFFFFLGCQWPSAHPSLTHSQHAPPPPPSAANGPLKEIGGPILRPESPRRRRYRRREGEEESLIWRTKLSLIYPPLAYLRRIKATATGCSKITIAGQIVIFFQFGTKFEIVQVT